MGPGFAPPPDRVALGTRIQVWGNSCSGKSTLAARLGAALELPVVELDALNWRPGWTSVRETDRAAFDASVVAACSGPGWVVAGCYGDTSLPLIWPHLQTLVWLDLPRGLAVRRMLARSWRRWRSRELLWGQVRERFWPQLMVWRGEESLLWWIWTQHARKRRQVHARAVDPRWRHVRFVRLGSPAEIERWIDAIEREGGAKGPSG